MLFNALILTGLSTPQKISGLESLLKLKKPNWSVPSSLSARIVWFKLVLRRFSAPFSQTEVKLLSLGSCVVVVPTGLKKLSTDFLLWRHPNRFGCNPSSTALLQCNS